MIRKFLQNNLFIVCITIASFLISAEYAITRPTGNAVFISAYGAKFFPFVWLATVPVNFLVIYLYNLFLPKVGCKKVFAFIICFAIAINLLAGFKLETIRSFPFFYFIWKDINILLLFKQLWSLIHSNVNLHRAKYLYGIITAVGGVGGIVGGCIPGFFAVTIGSEKLLLLTVPFYALLLLFYCMAVNKSGLQNSQESFSSGSKGAFGLIKNSPLLIFILFTVIFMQIAITFYDYQFNIFLEAKIPVLDQRTEFTGRLFSLVNVVTTLLQIVGSYLLIQFMGIRNIHFFIPLTLIGCAFSQLIYPGFLAASSAFIYIKSLDYSLFTIVREMLYIPMTLDEKFRAKVIIDVFAYRSARAFGSLVVLFGVYFAKDLTLRFLNISAIVIFTIWCFLVYYSFRPQEKTEAVN